MAATYDFVVVGAGPAGCVVASRLASSPGRPSVLLIEAGGLNESAAHLSGLERYEVAFRPGSPLNWGYKTQPQVKGQAIDYSRGKGLGGSTAINFCGWTVGPDDDFDQWADLVGDDAFAWKNVKRHLRKIENFHNDVPSQFRDYVNPSDTEHAVGGAVDVSYQQSWLETVRTNFEAAKSLGWGVNRDVNNGNPMGMGIGTTCIYNGIRVTSVSAYLSQPPSNLVIVSDAMVEKIVIENGTATCVRTVDGRTFKARKEIILSAGALNTPQILLLSGIGPADELKKHGIPVVHELSQVGHNLRDHCFSYAGIVIKKDARPTASQDPTPMGWFQIPAVYRSQEFGSLQKATQEYLQRPHIPNWELITHTPFAAVGEQISEDEDVFSTACVLTSPLSMGTVSLQSANATDAPLLDPKFLSHPFDRRVAIESMREMLKFLEAPAWKKRTIRKAALCPSDTTDEGLLDYFSSNMASTWHMCGTAKMGRDRQSACVDSAFKVIGLDHLRVVDLSVAPLIPNCHTQSTAYIVGEIAAEKLIREHARGAAPRAAYSSSKL